jgi:hypothetical protein
MEPKQGSIPLDFGLDLIRTCCPPVELCMSLVDIYLSPHAAEYV